jgi:hypothetical protein
VRSRFVWMVGNSYLAITSGLPVTRDLRLIQQKECLRILVCMRFVFDARAFFRFALGAPQRSLANRCLSLRYSCWSRFGVDVAPQEIVLSCSRSFATRSAFRSFASLQSA